MSNTIVVIMVGYSKWEILVWLSLATIFVWAVAKSFGWINTPFLVELAPVFAAVFAAGGFFEYIKMLGKEFRQLKFEVRHTNEELRGQDRRIIRIEAKLA